MYGDGLSRVKSVVAFLFGFAALALGLFLGLIAVSIQGEWVVLLWIYRGAFGIGALFLVYIGVAVMLGVLSARGIPTGVRRALGRDE